MSLLKNKIQILSVLFITISMLGLAACGIGGVGDGVETEAKYPTGADRTGAKDDIYAKSESIFGRDGLVFGGNKEKEEDNGIGVNSYLWRASLDTISFMPLASADPFGGVILTDWYAAPEKPNERFKLNVFILSKSLRSDGIRVRVFNQKRVKGNWKDAEVSKNMGTQLEDTILIRARQLRVASLEE